MRSHSLSADYLIVGAGYAGSIVAERLASGGFTSVVIDRRPHIAGNAFDEYDEHGVLIHRYGPHIFHTNSERVFNYLSRFTKWRPYEHRVIARLGDREFPFPINRRTLELFYGTPLTEDAVPALLEGIRIPQERVTNSEELVLNSVGRDLYEAFFRGYTRKQWGREPSQLSAGVAARIPVRTNDDDRYFADTYQAMPLDGYTRMFENILDHPNIEVRLESDFSEWKSFRPRLGIIYTGPIDEYFGHKLGPLPYRSLRFEHEHLAGVETFQPRGTVNYPDFHVPFTRITEFKYLSGQQHSGTSIVREYPEAEGDPYYPIPAPENEELYKQYRELADREEGTVFLGRLAQYRYYNMDQVAAAALVAAEKLGVDGEASEKATV